MINELAIKILFPSLVTLPNILKKVENPQRLELRVGLRRCWGEGSWNDSFMRGMRQTISRRCSMRHLRQRKGREKADMKKPTFDCPGQLRLHPNYRGELLLLQYFVNTNLLFFV